MTHEPNWNMSDLLANASEPAAPRKTGKRTVPLEDSPAVYMRAGRGFEDYLVATGRMNAEKFIMDPQEKIRVRRLFIPQRIENRKGDTWRGGPK